MKAWVRKLWARRGARGQSMVEFLVMLPVLLIMMSGLIEFGFLLNYYLDLIDAARDGARFASNVDPLPPDDHILNCSNSTYFYRLVPCVVNQALQPQITLDAARDDLVISSFSVAGGVVTARFPDADGWSLNSNFASNFTSAEIQAMLDPSAPNTGVVLVEIFYNYDMILGLPWITAFISNPVVLHAYTIMPNTFVEPTRTPG
jgi:hypothetical protein